MSGLPFLAQDLDFHDQLANAPGGLAKLCLQRIVLALLEARIHAGQGTPAPFLEPVDRHRYLARNGIHWLAAQQVSEPARLIEELGKGKYTPAIGLLDNPGENDGLLELLLQFVPILLWPQTASLSPEHCHRVNSCWYLLPEGFLTAYRARWRTQDADLVADIRAVWDDEDWLRFCRGIEIGPSAESRSD